MFILFSDVYLVWQCLSCLVMFSCLAMFILYSDVYLVWQCLSCLVMFSCLAMFILFSDVYLVWQCLSCLMLFIFCGDVCRNIHIFCSPGQKGFVHVNLLFKLTFFHMLFS